MGITFLKISPILTFFYILLKCFLLYKFFCQVVKSGYNSCTLTEETAMAKKEKIPFESFAENLGNATVDAPAMIEQVKEGNTTLVDMSMTNLLDMQVMYVAIQNELKQDDRKPKSEDERDQQDVAYGNLIAYRDQYLLPKINEAVTELEETAKLVETNKVQKSSITTLQGKLKSAKKSIKAYDQEKTKKKGKPHVKIMDVQQSIAGLGTALQGVKEHLPELAQEKGAIHTTQRSDRLWVNIADTIAGTQKTENEYGLFSDAGPATQVVQQSEKDAFMAKFSPEQKDKAKSIRTGLLDSRYNQIKELQALGVLGKGYAEDFAGSVFTGSEPKNSVAFVLDVCKVEKKNLDELQGFESKFEGIDTQSFPELAKVKTKMKEYIAKKEKELPQEKTDGPPVNRATKPKS